MFQVHVICRINNLVQQLRALIPITVSTCRSLSIQIFLGPLSRRRLRKRASKEILLWRFYRGTVDQFGDVNAEPRAVQRKNTTTGGKVGITLVREHSRGIIAEDFAGDELVVRSFPSARVSSAIHRERSFSFSLFLSLSLERKSEWIRASQKRNCALVAATIYADQSPRNSSPGSRPLRADLVPEYPPLRSFYSARKLPFLAPPSPRSCAPQSLLLLLLVRP